MAEQIISRFFVVGINYRTASAEQRSMFSLSETAYTLLLQDAKQANIRSLFALSTCNRSEIYFFGHDESIIVDLFLRHTKGDINVFKTAGFVKRGTVAFEHLFNVAAGFDSQILGDYEVLGQLKKAVLISRGYDMIGPVMDRTINFAQQASKAIKTKTHLSTGTVSVSYAAVEWLKNNIQTRDKKILLFGTGKFGRNIAKNLRHYFESNIVVINRTDETAKQFAEETGLNWRPFNALKNVVQEADVIIVCTHSSEYTILPEFLTGEKPQCIMDLSVPLNVHPDVTNINGVQLAGIDEVSQILRHTMEKRKGELPKAKAIISEYLGELNSWMQMQRYSPIIKELKSKLHQLSPAHVDGTQLVSCRVNKTISELAVNLREKNEKGCLYIHAFKDFLQPGVAE